MVLHRLRASIGGGGTQKGVLFVGDGIGDGTGRGATNRIPDAA